MKKILLSCLIGILFSATAKGQFTYGPELSFNISNYALQSRGFLSPVTLWFFGARIGGVADYAVSDNISLQPGLYYAINGIKYSYSFVIASAEFSAHINTIQIPLNVQYKIGQPGGNRFFVGIGPFIGINLGGAAKVSASSGFLGLSFDSSANFTVGNDSSDFLKRFDYGAGINAGYEMANGLFFRAYYQRGLVNITPPNQEISSIKSVNFGVSAGYLIGTKKNKKKK